MNQRTERLGAEIQAVLAELIARGEIRDPRVHEAGIVTITWVRVTGDLSEARVGFTVFGADGKSLERVRQGLQAARAYLQQILARKLRARKTATLSFEIDRTLDNAFRVDGLLRGEAAARSAPVVSGDDLPGAVSHPDNGGAAAGASPDEERPGSGAAGAPDATFRRE
ncbi:MAG: 30S ribosome-binding factor RbfA [Pseudomonadota bacterium]